MKKSIKTCLVSLIILIIVLSAVSCSQTPESAISQAEYDAVKAQLAAAEAKIIELQAKPPVTTSTPGEPAPNDEIISLKAEIENLEDDINDLNALNDTLAKDKATLETMYQELNTKYINLQNSIPTPEPPEELTEEKVENEILRLLNLERVNAGVPELEYGKNLYSLARQNGRNMHRLGRYDYDVSVAYQEVFWGINYESLESISTAALKTWMLNQYRFKTTALLNTNKYGAVGAYFADGVFFITFMAGIFP